MTCQTHDLDFGVSLSSNKKVLWVGDGYSKFTWVENDVTSLFCSHFSRYVNLSDVYFCDN